MSHLTLEEMEKRMKITSTHHIEIFDLWVWGKYSSFEHTIHDIKHIFTRSGNYITKFY